MFCGLPIYFELLDRGYRVHLASYSVTEISLIQQVVQLTDSLIGVTADSVCDLAYFPEGYLVRWFREQLSQEVTIWCFEKTGVRPLIDNYRALIEHLKIDAILLVDGGVDSLLRGDEAQMGTILEDAISLIAVSELKKVSVRLMACLGLGAEQDIHYAHVFENIAKLTELNAFQGSCSLHKQMEPYGHYEAAVAYVQSQPRQDPSVINSSVISAVQGHYGNYHLTDKTRGSRLWISPLMSIYWFFEITAVARRNLLFPNLRYTDTRTEAYRGLVQARRGLALRKPAKIPLP
ncbi:MAG: DUF1152 domain-containing protein [Chloroflexota bacterium]